mgnify:CR=1 FL=1
MDVKYTMATIRRQRLTRPLMRRGMHMDALVTNAVDGCIAVVVDYKKGQGILTDALKFLGLDFLL